jgi:hypothetical protein
LPSNCTVPPSCPAPGKSNLVYWEFPGLDHGMVDATGLSHMAEVIASAARWAASATAPD